MWKQERPLQDRRSWADQIGPFCLKLSLPLGQNDLWMTTQIWTWILGFHLAQQSLRVEVCCHSSTYIFGEVDMPLAWQLEQLFPEGTGWRSSENAQLSPL